MVQKLDWKQSSDPQIASLSFIFAHDRCPEAAPRAQAYLHISFHPPIWILQIYRKNKQLGSFGRSSLPGAEKSSGSALWGSSLWPCLSWILLGIPTCSRSCRGKRLVCPWHSGSSPFPLLAPFPLGTALPMPVVSRVHILFTFLSLVAYGIYKSYFISLWVLRNHTDMKFSFVFWIQFL